MCQLDVTYGRVARLYSANIPLVFATLAEYSLCTTACSVYLTYFVYSLRAQCKQTRTDSVTTITGSPIAVVFNPLTTNITQIRCHRELCVFREKETLHIL